MLTYEQILNNRSDIMEFHAKIAGAEVKGSNRSQSAPAAPQPSETKKTNLVDRLRNKTESDKMTEAKQNGSSKFSEGVGYKVI